MFNWFKKREGKKTYEVYSCCLSLCKGLRVAEFESKEAAEEYARWKNETCEDPDFEWYVM